MTAIEHSSKPAVLVVGHGSRSRAGVEEFHRLADHLRSHFPDRLCATGFLEFARPTIDEGLDELLARGARQITAVPGMLMAAGHAKNDIPSELNAYLAAHPGITITYGVELGLHAKMLQAARARVEAALTQQHGEIERNDTLLLVVGRGASDSDANSNVAKITRMLWEGLGFGWAETCFSGVAHPLVPEALQRVRRLGFRQIVVFPYFLFAGRLIDRIYAAADEYQAAHADVRIVKAPYLNDHPKVLEAFVDRLEEAERGDGRMNCQLCHYREQIIGYEDRVGTPQAGHHHHVRGIGTDEAPAHDHAHQQAHGHHHHHHHPDGHGTNAHQQPRASSADPQASRGQEERVRAHDSGK